jgi:hypothetical protein
LVSGDSIQANVASSGTPGSGTAVVGIPTLDTSGNLNGIFVPRTNSLSQLTSLISEPTGELASATDNYAIVQYQPSSVVVTYQPSYVNLTVSGIIPAYPRSVMISSGTVFTIANGIWNGQLLEVSLAISATSTSINGVYFLAGSYIVFRWSTASSTWQPIYVNSASTTSTTSQWGANSISFNGSIAIGNQTFAASQGAAYGLSSTAFSGTAYGVTSLAFGGYSGSSSANAYGDSSIALLGTAQGQNSLAVGQFASTGDSTKSVIPVTYSAVVAGGNTNNPVIKYICTTNTNAGLFNATQNSKVVFVPNSGGPSYSGYVNLTFCSIMYLPLSFKI